MDRSSWPIIVGGCHRSGTSLLRRMLDSHPRIHCGPEVTFFRDLYGAYRDDPLCHLRFTTTARTLLPEEELLELLGGVFLEAHERAARRAGKARWADKSPDNVLYTAGWEHLLGEQWLLVHVVRNPLDTIASMTETRFPLTLPADLEGRIDFYRRYTEAGLDFGVLHPDRYLLVVYEALVAAPEPVLASVMSWLGERLDACQLSFNAVPHGEGLEDPKIAATTVVHGESVGRWRAMLTAEDAAAVWARTRDLWRRLDPDARHEPGNPPFEAGALCGS
jgi:hypothetical protein